jgi:hypothetical protein
MIMFFLNHKETSKFLTYLRECGLPDPKPIGKPQYAGTADDYKYYQQYMVDLQAYDLTMLKMMFDIKHSLFERRQYEDSGD